MDQTPSPEGSIETLSKPSFQHPKLGLLCAAIPALCALVYLDFFQGNNEEGAPRTSAENLLAQRGALIKYEHDRLIKNVDQALALLGLMVSGWILRAAGFTLNLSRHMELRSCVSRVMM